MIDPNIRAVYFDAVGTLIFPSQPVSTTYAEFAARHGIQVDRSAFAAAFRNAFLRQERIDEQNGWRTDEERERNRWQTIIHELFPNAHRTKCFEELWDWYSKPEAWRVNADFAEGFIQLAKRGLKVGVASNFDSRLNGLIATSPDLSTIKNRCVISSLTGWRKPAREFFVAVANNAGCLPEQLLYVGDDSRNDIQGATAAGCKAILFDPDDRVPGGSKIRRLRDLWTA